MITRAGPDHWYARRPSLHPSLVVAAVTLLVGLPLIVALVDLHDQHWYPVLDLAMTEFRVRDVGTSHSPLIGLPGRIAPGPEQGSHPGPLSFYALAPLYRLFGSSSWALELSTVALHLVAIVTALWLAHRRGGWHGVIGVGAMLAIVVRGYGQLLLTQPWNPYLPLLAWIVVLLCAWSVLCGDSLALVPMVVAGTFCAQTHVPYLLPAGALTIGCIVLHAVRLRRDQTIGRVVGARLLVAAVLAGVALWLPPLIDQLRNDPGNVRKLLDHFGSPPDDPIGVADGLRLALRHLDVWAGFAGQFADTGRFVSPSSTWRGAIVLVIWIVAAGWALRHGPRSLRDLHIVVAAALALGALAMIRIFGLPWYYLTLWAWGTSTVVLGAVAWTAIVAWRRAGSRARAPGRERPASRPPAGGGAGERSGMVIPGVAVAVLVGASISSSVSFADAEVPEERLSIAVGALAAPSYEAAVAGVGAATGPDAVYQVRWSDAADIGSPGFGLLNDLERRGLDVRADPFFHIPATDHRTRDRATAARNGDAQLHLATGSYVGQWRLVSEAVEVATYEPRDAGDRERFDDVRRRLVERLAGEGLDGLVGCVDTNLFGGSLDPRLSDDDIADFTILLELGQPMAVFIAPAEADAPAGDHPPCDLDP